jgi:hypothetical protein
MTTWKGLDLTVFNQFMQLKRGGLGEVVVFAVSV